MKLLKAVSGIGVIMAIEILVESPGIDRFGTKEELASYIDREIGIQPDILLCRSDRPITSDLKDKIALFGNVEKSAVISAEDVGCIYEVPLVFHREGLDDLILKELNVWTRAPRLEEWEKVVKKIYKPRAEVTIAIVGKYVDLQDSYKSLHQALIHGGIAGNCRVKLEYIDAEDVEKKGAAALLKGVDGLLVPGGFGTRGIEGMVLAIKYAREKGMPFFGICLGMQVAVIELARNLAGLKKANSAEFDDTTSDPIVHIMEGQKGICAKGGTMRLGAYPCTLKRGTKAYSVYGAVDISERHRHRFEFNNTYRDVLKEAGVEFSGLSPDGHLVEIMELKGHPWFVACQFHPEFKCRPLKPHPLFRGFIKAVLSVKRAAEKAGKVKNTKKPARAGKKASSRKVSRKKTTKKSSGKGG